MKFPTILTATLLSAVSLSTASASLMHAEGDLPPAPTAPLNAADLAGLDELEAALIFPLPRVQTPNEARFEQAQHYAKNAAAAVGTAWMVWRVARYMGFFAGPEHSVVELDGPSVHILETPKTILKHPKKFACKPAERGYVGKTGVGFTTTSGLHIATPGRHGVTSEEPSFWWRLFVGQ